MQSVFDKHHLDGSLDTTSADAGLPGQNIDGVDIRVYECNSQTGGSLGGLIDGEVAPGIGYMIDGGWEDMGTGVLADHIDGLKIPANHIIYPIKHGTKVKAVFIRPSAAWKMTMRALPENQFN